MKRSDIEIMAPVGSYESLAAAIRAGADAVYFGVGKLNMRSASAANFTLDDLGRIVASARKAGVKTYLTVNTIVYEDEIADVHAVIDRAKKEGVDAVIASDMAAILYARRIGQEVHISTQSNISNSEAVRFYAQWADTVVLARELSLEQVAAIRRRIVEDDIRGPRGELVEIEMFAHGALCMSVSGKCYLSLYETNCSANRGACRQLCRRKYTVTDKETGAQLDIDGRYVLSPKDLCTIDFLDKMIALVEGASRQKTPNEIALTILLAGFTLVFVIVCATLKPFADYVGANLTIAALISLFVCLIPTTIGGLLSAIGIAGMDRALQANVITKSGRAVETAGDVDTLLLDKTGTITIGNRKATRFHPIAGTDPAQLIRTCMLSSVSDETPEGKSILELGRSQNVTINDMEIAGARMIKFTAETKCSGADLADGRRIRKGAFEAIRRIVEQAGHPFDTEVERTVKKISENGGTPLVVCENEKVTGVIELQDIIKPGIRERFDRLRRMGVKTVMVTGDNPLTAKYIAEKAGVDDFIAEAKPEDKMEYIKREQQSGKLVAMMGDGTNDAPALAQADVGVAMNSGTQAAKEAGNMVDLDNDPTKLIEIVEIGKQLLMTRGTLTTFSIANDVAKYFAIVPALFIAAIPSLEALNLMHLHSPESAILSAVIFNAIIIPLLIPLALRGVRYKPIGASALLRRNLFIYGLGGVLVPFVGIKLIDLLISVFF